MNHPTNKTWQEEKEAAAKLEVPDPLRVHPSTPAIPKINDGSNAGTNHYDLPVGATEIKHLIWHKDMNGQVAEIFRAAYRLGTATHSSRARDLRKIIAYAEQELERMERYATTY